MDAPSTAEPTLGLLVRLWRFVKMLCLLSALTAAASIAAWIYGHDQLDEQVRLRAEARLQDHYRGLIVTLRAARRVEGAGIELRGLVIREGGGPDAPIIAEIDEALAACDTKLPEFLLEPPKITDIKIRGVHVRAERKPSGAWCASNLIPFPDSGGAPPSVTIVDGSIEIVDPSRQAGRGMTLRDIDLTMQPIAANLALVETGSAPRPSPSAIATTGQATTVQLLHIRGQLSGDHFERAEIDGIINPNDGAWDLRGAVEGLEFSPRLRATLPLEATTLVEPLASVRGRTHFSFAALRGPRDPLTKAFPRTTFVVNGEISEGRIDDARLPDPLTDVEATLRCDNDGFVIQKLTARCGATRLDMSADVRGYAANSPIRLELHATRLEVDRIPVDSLSVELQQVWSKFSPRGLVDVDAVLNYDGLRWDPDLIIRCHALSIEYDQFRYRVTDGHGSIELKNKQLSVRYKAVGGGQVISCRADIQEPGPNFTGWVEMQSEGPVPIDEKLIAAMDAKGQKLVRMFSPKGAVSVQARFQRDTPDDIVHRKLNVSMHDGSIIYEHFAYPIDKLSGSLQLTDNDWIFHNLSGRNDSGYIVGQGHWLDDAPDGDHLALNLTATDLPLEDELRRALSPGVQRLWANLRPRGNIDHLGVQVRYNAISHKLSLDVDAQKWSPGQNIEGRTISVEPEWFRYRLDNVTGGMHYRDGVVELTNLHAVHGRATVAAEGRCDILADGNCRVQLSRLASDRVPIDHELLAAMPEGIGSALARLALTGPINMQGALNVLVPPHEQPPAIGWDLNFEIENGSLNAGAPIEHIHGGMRLLGQSSNGEFVSSGELDVESAIVRDLQLTQIQGPIWIDSKRIAFGANAHRRPNEQVPRQVTASTLGGLLTLDGQVEIGGDGPFTLRASLENADLPQVMRELAPRQPGLNGKVFALVNLTGTGQGLHTYRGDGQVRLRDANIYELPLMISTLKLLSVHGPADRTAFTNSNIDFRIAGDDLEFDRIDLNGDAISLKGKGRLTGRRDIDLKFYTQVGRDELQLPLFRPVLGEASREFMLIEVTGTVDDPVLNRTAFPRLNERLQILFPELAGQRNDPIPAPTVPIISMPREMLQRRGLLPQRK